jgi:uncharacterized protein (TIRG00374 family)
MDLGSFNFAQAVGRKTREMRIRRQFIFALWITLLFIGAILFFWTFRSVPFGEIVEVLSSLTVSKILILLLVNVAILLIAPLRWWLILKAQNQDIPYLALVAYRQAAFAVSYFTPGQNFGGEPVQVLALRNRHKVPGSTALASVTLDRAIELIINLIVLIFGIALVTSSGIVTGIELQSPLLFALVFLFGMIFYLILLRSERRPVKWLLKKFKGKFVSGLQAAEDQLGELIQQRPSLFLVGLLCSALVWGGLFFEFWLALDFLGLPLNLSQLVLVVTAGRVALLAPTPGALGALEASQMLAVQALGFDPAIGLSLGLLIRARDVLFAVVGLIFGGLGLR